MIKDEYGKELQIGMRVGCRNHGEPRSCSHRGLTLEGYDSSSDKPFITNAGSFALAMMDHQPDMVEWVKDHVKE